MSPLLIHNTTNAIAWLQTSWNLTSSLNVNLGLDVSRCVSLCLRVTCVSLCLAVCVCVCFPAARSVSLSSWVLCFIEFSVVHCFLLVAMCCFVSLTVSCRLHFCLAFSLLLGCCLFLSLAMSSCVAVYPLDLAGSCWVSLSLSLSLSLSILYISCVLQSQQRYKRSS